ncbi:RAP domain-containing protein [Orientia tsutsugamushi]|uniref:RAP domain-containing protein n=1 Tax=Orientia tsutsugamushi TaxID=784 RepID=UPI004046B01B
MSTRLNTELLKSYGYIVHRIPYWIWDKLRTNTDKEKYICELWYALTNLFLNQKCQRRYSMMHKKIYQRN